MMTTYFKTLITRTPECWTSVATRPGYKQTHQYSESFSQFSTPLGLLVMDFIRPIS